MKDVPTDGESEMSAYPDGYDEYRDPYDSSWDELEACIGNIDICTRCPNNDDCFYWLEREMDRGRIDPCDNGF